MVYGFNPYHTLTTPRQRFDSQACLDESARVKKLEQTDPSSTPQSSDSSSLVFFLKSLLGSDFQVGSNKFEQPRACLRHSTQA